MSLATNQINIYKKLSSYLIEAVEFRVGDLLLSYTSNNEEIDIELNNENKNIKINDYNSDWNPAEHNLILRQRFYFTNPHLMFGENGIVDIDNTIGLGVHIYSTESFFQKTIDFGNINFSRQLINIEFKHEFPPKSIRGRINLDFFIYLKNFNSTINGQAKSIGLRLCNDNLHSYTLIVDGDGSDFPILEFQDKKGPLWKIEKNWVDARDDYFNSSNIHIALNTNHHLFDKVKDTTTWGSKTIMGEIMLQALTMIINEVVNVEKHDLTSDDIIPGTILMIVKYWVETFEVQTDSIYSISNSLRTNQGDLLYGG